MSQWVLHLTRTCNDNIVNKANIFLITDGIKHHFLTVAHIVRSVLVVCFFVVVPLHCVHGFDGVYVLTHLTESSS